MGFTKCVLYAAVIGILSFFLGRVLPKQWFQPDRFPYRIYAWEQNGNFYNRVFHIRKWQSRVPDMSKILPGLIPAKKVTLDFEDRLPQMITETCIAEGIHWLLCIFSLPLLWLWPGIGGALFAILYILLGNLPFILIQRYNRPRFSAIAQRLARKENGKEEKCLH